MCSYCRGSFQAIALDVNTGQPFYDEDASHALFTTHRTSASAPSGAGCTSAQPWTNDATVAYYEATSLTTSYAAPIAPGTRKVVTPPYTCSADDRYISVSAAGTVTLAPASNMPNGAGVDIKNTHTAAITVARSGANTIDGATSTTVSANGTKRFTSNSVDKYEVN